MWHQRWMKGLNSYRGSSRATLVTIILTIALTVPALVSGSASAVSAVEAARYFTGEHELSGKAIDQFAFLQVDFTGIKESGSVGRSSLSFLLRSPAVAGYARVNSSESPSGIELVVCLLRESMVQNGTIPPGNSSAEATGGYQFDQKILSVIFDGVIEYTDANGDGRFSAEDYVTQEHQIGALSFSKPIIGGFTAQGEKVVLTTSEGERPVISGTFTDGDRAVSGLYAALTGSGPATITVEVALFFSPTTYKGVALTASEAKVDLRLVNILYREASSMIALSAVVFSRTETITRTGSGNWEGIQGNYQDAIAFFNWTKQAEIDGISASVGSIVVSESASRARLYLSYARGSAIYHDPVAGFRIENLTSDNEATVWLVAAAAVPTLLVLLRIARRKAGQ